MKAEQPRIAVDPGRVRVLDYLDRTLAELSAAQRPLRGHAQQQPNRG